MTVVDLHSHFFPETWPDLAERFGTPDWPWMRRDGPDRAMVMLGSREFRPITSACWDASVRLADMDRDGVDVQVVSATPVLFAYGRPRRARHGVRPHLQRRPARAVLARCRAPGADRPGPAPGHRSGLPGARPLPGGRHAGCPDRQPRGRPRPRRRGDRDLPRPLRVGGSAGVRPPVGHVRRLPAGGLDAPVDGRDAGRDAAVAEPDDPRRRLRPPPARPEDLLRPRGRLVHVPPRPARQRLAPTRHRPRAVDARRRAPTSTASRSTPRCTSSGPSATSST